MNMYEAINKGSEAIEELHDFRPDHYIEVDYFFRCNIAWVILYWRGGGGDDDAIFERFLCSVFQILLIVSVTLRLTPLLWAFWLLSLAVPIEESPSPLSKGKPTN